MIKKKQLKNYQSLLLERRNKLLTYRQEHKAAWNTISKREKDLVDQANLDNLLREMSQMDERRQQEIREIEYALDKIDLGVYGLCEVCDEPIESGRMKALPYARLCLQCAEERERFGSARLTGRTVNRNRRPNNCHDLIEAIADAIEEDDRIGGEDLEISCTGNQLLFSGSLANAHEQHVLMEIVAEITNGDDAIFDIRVESLDSEMDLLLDAEEDDHQDTARMLP